MELSKEAKRALVNAAGRIGAHVAVPNSAVAAELSGIGVINTSNNLTRQGTIVRARVLDEMLEAF